MSNFNSRSNTPYDQGMRAREHDIPRSHNPYMSDPDRTDWFRGWDDANKEQKERVK